MHPSHHSCLDTSISVLVHLCLDPLSAICGQPTSVTWVANPLFLYLWAVRKRYPDRDMRPLNPGKVVQWLFSSRGGPRGRLVPRFVFLRALAAIYFSAFFSLLFQ